MIEVVEHRLTAGCGERGLVRGGDVLRLTIVDDHQLFRECLAAALAEEDRFAVTSIVPGGERLLEELAARPADVLVLGLSDCREAASLVRQVGVRFPRVRTLILGPRGAGGEAVECFAAGAKGFLFRDQSLADLRSAVHGIVRGGTVCPPRIAQALFLRLADLGRERRRRERLGVLDLTTREQEILQLIAEGLSNQEIAGRLFLSVHTVKNHIHKILEVLDVQSRWGAVRHAVGKGWLPDRGERKP